jgi:hypothetical protein
MYKALRVTPRNGTDDLWKPPMQIVFANALEGVRLEDVPESAALCVVHNEVEMRPGLESTQEMWRPDRAGTKSAKKDLPF